MASLSGDKTLAELPTEFGVHPTMISNWKQELVRTGVMPLCMWKLQLGWLVTETLRRPISSISASVT